MTSSAPPLFAARMPLPTPEPPTGATANLGFWPLVRRKAALVALFILIFGGLGAYQQLHKPVGYVATSKVFSNSKRASNIPVSQTTYLAVQRMESYVKLVGTTRLAQRLVRTLGLAMSPKSLAANMDASLNKDTVIMSVTVVAPTRGEATEIADALPGEFTEMVNQLNNVASTDQDATDFTIVDGPFVSKNSSVKRLAVSILFGLVLGGAIGLAIVAVIARRRADHGPAALVAITGVPIVGVIPNPSVGNRSPWKRFSKANEVPSALLEARRLAHHRLARNISHLGGTQHRVVVVCSPSGLPPSGLTATGLATALAVREGHVLLIDASFKDIPLEMISRSGTGSSALAAIHGEVPIESALGHTAISNLAQLDLGPSSELFLESDGSKGLGKLVRESRKKFDTTLVNSVPVLSPADIPTCVEEADVVLVVVDPQRNSTAEILSAINGLRAMSEAQLGLVLYQPPYRDLSASQYEIGLVLPQRSVIGELSA